MSMFGIDLSRKNQSDTADLKFDEIIPMRIKTNTRIRQSDIDLIQTRIREECILLDDALDNSIAQSEADMELAEEIHRVKEMYAGMNPVDIDNPYEAELYQDERDYDTMKQGIMDQREQATVTHDERLDTIFQRVCDTAYQSQSEMPVEVTGRRSDGAKQTWVFVTQDTRLLHLKVRISIVGLTRWQSLVKLPVKRNGRQWQSEVKRRKRLNRSWSRLQKRLISRNRQDLIMNRKNILGCRFGDIFMPIIRPENTQSWVFWKSLVFSMTTFG